MNFIAETNKYARLIEAWKNGHGFSDREALQDIANLWDEFKALPERRSVIYPGSNTIAPKTDLSCASCVYDLLTYVYNWRRALVHEVPQDIPNVPQATIETVKMSFDVRQTFPGIKAEELPEVVSDPPHEFKSYKRLDTLKMHEIRSIAKKKGLEYTNKTTKEELIQLLSNG